MPPKPSAPPAKEQHEEAAASSNKKKKKSARWGSDDEPEVEVSQNTNQDLIHPDARVGSRRRHAGQAEHGSRRRFDGSKSRVSAGLSGWSDHRANQALARLESTVL